VIKLRRPQLLDIILGSVAGGIMLFFVFQLVDFKEAFSLLGELQMWEVGAMFLFSIGYILTGAIRWYTVYRAQTDKPEVSLWNFFLLFFAGFPIDYVFRSLGISGQLGRSYLASFTEMKKKVKISSLSTEYIIRSAVNTIAGGIVLVVLVTLGFSEFNKYIWLTGILAVVFFIVSYYFWKGLSNKYAEYKDVIKKGFQNHQGWMSLAFLSVLLGYGVVIAQIYFVAIFLGIDLSLFEAVIFYFITRIFLGFPSPFSVGTYEAGGALSFSLLGLVTPVGLGLTFALRLADIFSVITGSGLILFLIIKNKTKKK